MFFNSVLLTFSLWYLWLLLWIFSLCGYGYLFSRAFMRDCSLDKTIYKIFFYGIIGCILVSSLVILLNLFIPISFPISVGLLVIGLIGALFWYVREGSEKRIYAASFVFISAVTYISTIFFGTKVGDTQIYHLHVIDWIVSNPLPYGLTNLNTHLGFATAWFPLGAVVEQPLFLFNYQIFLISAIILTLYGMLLVSITNATYTRVKGKVSFGQIITNLKYSEWFFVLSILPVSIYSYGYIASPSPDYPVFFLTLVVFGSIINYIESESQNKNNLLWLALICALFAAGIKLSAIMLVPLVFLFIALSLLRETPVKQMLDSICMHIRKIPFWCYVLSFLAIIPSSIWAFIASGSPIYPKTIPIIHNIIPWSVPHSIAESTSQGVLAWARSPGPGYLESLHGYDWVSGWIISFLTWQKGILTLVFILSIAICICLTCYAIHRKKRMKGKITYSIPYLAWYPFFMIGVGLLFWFFTGPAPRFAAGYLFSLPVFLIIYPYLMYRSLFPEQVITWSKISITIIFATMTIGITGYCFVDSVHDDNLPKPMQTLTYIGQHAVGADIVYVFAPNFPQENKGWDISRHPLLTTLGTFNSNLVIHVDPITGYYRMFQTRGV